MKRGRKAQKMPSQNTAELSMMLETRRILVKRGSVGSVRVRRKSQAEDKKPEEDTDQYKVHFVCSKTGLELSLPNGTPLYFTNPVTFFKKDVGWRTKRLWACTFELPQYPLTVNAALRFKGIEGVEPDFVIQVDSLRGEQEVCIAPAPTAEERLRLFGTDLEKERLRLSRRNVEEQMEQHGVVEI